MTSFQQVRFSLDVEAPPKLDVTPLLTIFSRWRLEESPMRWIDLADYAHVPVGPAAMIVGRRGNLAFERTYDSAFLVYRNRLDLDGGPVERLREATRRGLALLRRLVGEREFPSEIHVLAGRGAIDWPDRVSVSDEEESRTVLEAAVRALLDQLYGPDQYTVAQQALADGMLGFRFEASRPVTLQELEGRP